VHYKSNSARTKLCKSFLYISHSCNMTFRSTVAAKDAWPTTDNKHICPMSTNFKCRLKTVDRLRLRLVSRLLGLYMTIEILFPSTEIVAATLQASVEPNANLVYGRNRPKVNPNGSRYLKTRRIMQL